MGQPEAISPSQITLYQTCSLKYRFQYVDRLPRLFSAAGMVFGGAIHAALEWLHKERKAGRRPPLDQFLRVFEADWNAQCLDHEVRFTNDDTAEKLILKGKELLSQYYHLPAKPVRGAEVFFQLPLVNPRTGEVLDVPLRGVIDLVDDEDCVTEFKASQKAWSNSDVAENVQLTTYCYAFEMLYGRRPREIRLVNLVRTKTPKIEAPTTTRGKADHERLFYLANEVVKGIRAGVFIPNRGCWMCHDCEYDRDCREWTGNES